MENEDQNIGNQAAGGALSIYGQADAAMDDFPVLKAFQQYIDAEQSKSRKRMILLCMFFGVLMTILVSVFVLILGQMSRDKQHVNDQLIEFLMKERDRAQTAVQQPAPATAPASNPAQDAAMKAVTETLAALQQQIADQRKADEEAAAAAPTKAELERERRAEEEAARLRKIHEKIEAEKRALAEEKKRLHEEEVERQRRRLYPEYYQKQSEPPSQSARQQPASPSPAVQPVQKKRPQLTDEDIDDILREVDSLKAADEAKARAKAKKEKKSSAKTSDKNDSDKDKKADKPIEYFTDSEYALPVKVDGEDTSFSFALPDEEEK